MIDISETPHGLFRAKLLLGDGTVAGEGHAAKRKIAESMACTAALISENPLFVKAARAFLYEREGAE